MPEKKVAVPADVEALSPEKETIVLSTGLEVKVERLKTRGMLRLMKIVTRGAGPIFMQMELDTNSEGFGSQLLAIVLMSIPEAEDEVLDFIRTMVVPSEYVAGAKDKATQARNEELFAQLAADLDDPDPSDTIEIISSIVTNEAPHMQALGKQLAALLKTQTNFSTAKN